MTLAALPIATAAAVAFWAYALFVFYLAYISILAAHEAKRLKRDELSLALALAYVTLGIGYALDVGFNVTVGTAVFLEAPSRTAITFTKRCRKWRDDTGYRGAVARAVCRALNVYQDGHC